MVSDLPPGASKKTDTLMLHMESRTGAVRRLFYPFRKKLLGGTVFDEHYSREVQPLLVGK